MTERGRLTDASAREFLAEAGEIVETMATGFSEIDEQRRQGSVRPATLNEVFRAAHSLKGLAGMFGIEGIGTLAHEMESLLDGLRLGRLLVDDDLMQALYACTDAFVQLLGAVREGAMPEAGPVRGLIDRVRAFAGKSPTIAEGLAQVRLAPEALAVLTEYEEHRLQENLRARTPIWRVHAPLELSDFEERLGALTDLLGKTGEVITTLPSADATGSGITFDIVAASSEPEAVLRLGVERIGGGKYRLDRIDERGAAGIEIPAPPAPPAAARLAEPVDGDDAPLSVRQIAETVRVDIKKLDELMGIVGELVLARGGLGRVSDQLKGELGYRGLAVDLHRLVRTMERRIADLQTAIMQVRMIPLGQVFDRLARVVRRTAGELGKEIELVVSGEETELDKLIVEELVDPLMHLVRNSIDHGIEEPAARVAAGKPRKGTVGIQAYPRGNHVVIDLTDDGRGIDEVAVKRTALERGIVDEERVGSLGRREVWNLIFAAGFSTKKSVSETSGRGVGLDVVKHNIARLSGIIDVYSEPGKGARFTITLPITLAIIQALIVRAGSQVFALPLASVLEIVLITERDLCTVDGREMVEVRGQTLPLLRLQSIFRLGRARARVELDEREGIGYVAVVGLAQHRVALFIDDVTGQQDIVIKSLGAFLSKVRGFAGATQLGDHETILVLDVAALVQDFLDSGLAEVRPAAAAG